jgi:ankyrin repeat protein
MQKKLLRWLLTALLVLPAVGLRASDALNGDILNAAEEGDADAVRRLIAYGADVNARDEAGRTPLHIVALGTAAEAAGVLLERKADFDARDHAGKTPLHLARRSVAIVNLLLNFGADANALTPDTEETPLHTLRDAEDPKIVEMLLARGADVGARDKEGQTPLHKAAVDGSPEVIRALVAAGAARDARDAAGRTPSELARAMENEENAKLIESLGQ